MSKVDDFLMHYVEQAYDPVKAHEYYLKNRDLKGRSTSGMSDAQKEAWIYAKNNITEDKKKEVESSKVANEQKIEAFRAATVATRKRIADKLKLLNERLSYNASNDREDIADKLKSDIENVADIPEGATGARREVLVKIRNKEIERIRDNASKYKAVLSSNIKDERQSNSDAASVEKEKTSSDLKSLLNETKESYAKSKDALNKSYEETYAKEHKRILGTIAGKPKKSGKGKGKGKSKDSGGGDYFKSLPWG
jgi:hypothetical protein